MNGISFMATTPGDRLNILHKDDPAAEILRGFFYSTGKFRAIPPGDSVADAQPIFSSECAKRANNLTVIKRVLCRMTEKEQAYVVLSRQAVSRRCCLSFSLTFSAFQFRSDPAVSDHPLLQIPRIPYMCEERRREPC